MKIFKRIAFVFLGLILVCLTSYAFWYTHERNTKLAQIKECSDLLEQPAQLVMMEGPPGVPNPVPVQMATPCPIVVAPPTLLNLMRGRLVFEGVRPSMKVQPYSLTDILLGRYVLSPDFGMGCDQSATTVPCATLEALSVSPSAPAPAYVPPNFVVPNYTFTTATNTSVTVVGYSFKLPLGWHGEIFSGFTGLHMLIQNSTSTTGFVVDCPPGGKGLEAAKVLTSVQRSFMHGDVNYELSFDKWTAPGNDPWHFIFIKTSQGGGELRGECIAQGSATPTVTEAMQMFYETFSIGESFAEQAPPLNP